MPIAAGWWREPRVARRCIPRKMSMQPRRLADISLHRKISLAYAPPGVGTTAPNTSMIPGPLWNVLRRNRRPLLEFHEHNMSRRYANVLAHVCLRRVPHDLMRLHANVDA